MHETDKDHVSCLEKELSDTKLVIHNITAIFTNCIIHDRAKLEQLTNKLEQLNSTIKQQEKKLRKAGNSTAYNYACFILFMNYTAKQEEEARVTVATLTKDLSITKAKCAQLEVCII